MKEIISEYLQILNDYLEVEESDGGIHYRLIEPEELGIVLESFWAIEYDKLTEKIKNFNGLKTINLGLIPENIEEFIKRSSLYSDLIIFEAPLDSFLIKTKLDDEKELNRLCSVASVKLLRLNEIKDWIDEGIVTLIPSIINQNIMLNNVPYLKAISTLFNNDIRDLFSEDVPPTSSWCETTLLGLSLS